MTLPRILLTGQDTAEIVWAKDLATGQPRITDILSIRTPGDPMPKGLLNHPARQLRTCIHDVPFDITPTENFGREVKSCTRAQIRSIIRFTRRVPVDGVVLIHCAAGISRSPAAALVFIAARLGPGREQEAADHLKKLRRTAPNPRIVYLGDEALGLNGRLFRVYRDSFWDLSEDEFDHSFTPARVKA